MKVTLRAFRYVPLLILCLVFVVCFSRKTTQSEETTYPILETAPTELPAVPETTVATIPVETTEPTLTPTTEPTETIEVTEPTEPEETEFVSYYSYTEEELDLLARLIYSEGGNQSYETQLKIGSVVMNRVGDPNCPNTIRGVIYQKNQFSVTFLKINGVIMIDRPASEESLRAAKQILDYGSILPSTVQVFYAEGCKEPWVTSRAIYEVSDNTVFAHIYKG